MQPRAAPGRSVLYGRGLWSGPCAFAPGIVAAVTHADDEHAERSLGRRRPLAWSSDVFGGWFQCVDVGHAGVASRAWPTQWSGERLVFPSCIFLRRFMP